MKTRRLISLLLAAVFLVSSAAIPALAASAAETEPAAAVAEENDMVSIRITAEGDLIYGGNYKLGVQTTPADVQYIAVAMGTKGEATGYVSLFLSDKIRLLLKMIPLPKKMSATPDQTEEFNVYSYLKQLIDGNDVSVLLRVADEVISVIDTVSFYVPADYLQNVKNVSNGMKVALKLIRKYLPEDAFSRIYLDEQPVDSGTYVAGAVALESGDINTAGFAMFKISPKTDNVRLCWAADLPGTMTAQEAAAFNTAAVVESDGQVVPNGKVSYTYKKQGALFSKKSSTLPTEPGTYTQTAKAEGNYSCSEITRTIVIGSPQPR